MHASPDRRRTRARLAAAAAAGAVLAPLVPTPASATPAAVWDRVAACESSGRWHVDTHNHYYGGLQFSQPTWIDFGGRQYAPRADRASRAQQIAVARRVLAAQGPGAWPVCGPKAQLTKASGAATSAPLPAIGAPSPAAAPVAPPRPATPRVQRYVVRSGDSLSAIAQRFGVAGGWQALWQYNRTNVPNPNVIMVGQLLQIP
jgi:hypothetical protein